MLADRIIATLAILSVVLFLGIIGWNVPRITLLIVLTVVVLMAAYDFWRELRPRRG